MQPYYLNYDKAYRNKLLNLEIMITQRKEIDILLRTEIYSKLSMDSPSNHEEILDFVVEDVQSTADPVEWHSGDVVIAFRRFIENQS